MYVEGTKLKFGASTKEYVFHGSIASSSSNTNGNGEQVGSKRKETSESDNSSKKSKNEIRCRHLLVKHKDSRRPSSWKEVCFIDCKCNTMLIDLVQSNITRTKEEAEEIVRGMLHLMGSFFFFFFFFFVC